MRGSILVILLVACGGSAPPPKQAEPPPPLQRTRIPIEEPDEDEGPQDGVQIQSTRGRMEPSAVEAGIEPHKTALSDCYMTKVGRRKWLGGHVLLKWEINKAGEITKAVLAESDLGAWSIEKCLLDIAKAATFGKPIGGDADFSIPLDFSAKGRVLTWDEDQALRAVGGQLATLDECAYPELAGKKLKKRPPNAKRVPLPEGVTVTLYVGPGGKAQSAGFASPNPIDDGWAECAEKLAGTWRLTDPRGVIAKLAIRYR